MNHVGGNFLKHVTDDTIDHSIGKYERHLLGSGSRSGSKVYSVCKEYCNVVLGFVSYVLSVRNCYLLTALLKLT